LLIITPTQYIAYSYDSKLVITKYRDDTYQKHKSHSPPAKYFINKNDPLALTYTITLQSDEYIHEARNSRKNTISIIL